MQVMPQAAEAAHTLPHFARKRPHLPTSLPLGLAVLLALSTLSACKSATPQKPAPPQPQGIPQQDVPLQVERKPTLNSPDGEWVTWEALHESYEQARRRAPQVNVPTISILGMEGATHPQREDTRREPEDDRPVPPFPALQPDPFELFTVVTLHSMQEGKGKTLVVLLIDRSASISYGDLPTVIKRMDQYFEEFNRSLALRIEDVGRWMVVSYGEKPKVECEPTFNIEDFKAALRKVEPDRSGKENLGAAVEFVLDNYQKGDYKHILIAAITDEAGDDIQDPVALERIIGELKEKKARFYVFGCESSFCARDKRVSIPLAQLKGKDLAEYQAYADATRQKIENLRIEGFAKGGPECPLPELWWGENWDTWPQWGGTLDNIPSGFGMYGLNRMALSSGGIYLLLKPESNYDVERFHASYQPDMCSVATYKKRIEESPLKKELVAIWQELGKCYLECDLRDAKTVEDVLKKSLDARQYCIASIQRLNALLNSPETARSPNPGRWLAHGDVTLAELHRLRFMLGQYHEVIRREWERQGKKLPEGKRFVVQRGKVPDDFVAPDGFVGPDAAKQEYDAALQYIQVVIERHKGTPWEVLAKRLQEGICPWKCVVADLPLSYKQEPSSKPPAQPPDIGL